MIEVKIHDLFWKDEKGWSYMMDSPHLKKGDVLTDGEAQYEVKEFRYEYPYLWLLNTSWVYRFEHHIPDCKGKILRKINGL